MWAIRSTQENIPKMAPQCTLNQIRVEPIRWQWQPLTRLTILLHLGFSDLKRGQLLPEAGNLFVDFPQLRLGLAPGQAV